MQALLTHTPVYYFCMLLPPRKSRPTELAAVCVPNSGEEKREGERMFPAVSFFLPSFRAYHGRNPTANKGSKYGRAEESKGPNSTPEGSGRGCMLLPPPARPKRQKAMMATALLHGWAGTQSKEEGRVETVPNNNRQLFNSKMAI